MLTVLTVLIVLTVLTVLSEDVSLSVGPLLIVEQSTLGKRPRGVTIVWGSLIVSQKKLCATPSGIPDVLFLLSSYASTPAP